MEIEAKFALPDEETLHRLEKLEQLAGYTLSAGETKQVHDLYLDTPDRKVLAGGYALRRRNIAGAITMYLKGLGGVEGPIHRREELAAALPSENPAETWRNSPVYARVYELTGDATLQPLFALRQTRIARQIRQAERTVAEMSLDEVRLTAGQREQSYYELEIELLADGTETDLSNLIGSLQQEWELKPLSSSKFQRALDFIDRKPAAGKLLTAAERTAVSRIANLEKALYSRRALALLALDEGASFDEAGRRGGLSPKRVKHWLGQFKKEKLNIFPVKVLIRAEIPSPSAEVLSSQPEKTGPPDTAISAAKLPDRPGLTPDDSMVEAAHKMLWFHFQRMVYHEPGTRLGEDVEELHDMRVATRRMRAAVQVFEDYLDMKQMRPFSKDLRKTARVLGVVRDLDVFWEKTQHYLDELPPAQQPDLEPLRAAWEKERQAGREKMLAYLDSRRYRAFKERFAAFLQDPHAGARPIFDAKGKPRPYRLRHVAPVALYQRLAAVRAYAEWVAGPETPLERLHQLRIDCKRLRYALEFFQEALSPAAKKLIREIKNLQNHLGDLQDAVVASALLHDFLTWGTWGHAKKEGSPVPAEPTAAPGVSTYLAYRQAELQNLVDTFPQTWEHAHSARFSQLLARAIKEL